MADSGGPVTKKQVSKKSSPSPLARLKARRSVLTGKGTEQMRASLDAQIEALEGKGRL